MTHTIHRYGRPEDLQYDYTIICLAARGFNRDGSQDKLKKFLQLCVKHNAVNFGNMEAGSKLVLGDERVIDAVKDGTTVQAVFKSEKDIVNILGELVELDLGLSMIVQGLEEKVKKCCKQTGATPHTWNHSLGVWGKKELLPEPEIMEITTMCGHGLVSVALIKDVVEKLQRGKIKLDKAIEKIVQPCICGIINPYRLEKILTRLALNGEGKT
jgi:hypothetical protein